MLLSVAIHIKALENGSMPQHLSPALRSLFLHWIAESSPKQAEYLHESNVLRPYTISDLQGSFRAQNGFYLVQAGESAWFRVTSLTSSISNLLLDSVFPSIQSKAFTIGETKFQVQRVQFREDEHPWARQSSYAELLGKYLTSNVSVSDKIKVEFLSPTMFHARNAWLPLPLPELVFGSWLRHWNVFSPNALFSGVNEFDAVQIAISKYDLKTTSISYDKSIWIGFTGSCLFRIISADETLRKMFYLLADFAFFSGTGAKTTLGMGQTR